LLLRMRIPTGLVLVALISVPWIWLVNQQYPEFFDFYIMEQHFRRYATDSAGRHMSWVAYVGVVFIGIFPWTAWLCHSTYKACTKADPIRLFFAIWVVVITLFFAFSNSVLVPYLLPIIAPASIVLAVYFDENWEQAASPYATYSMSLLSSLLGVAFIVAPFIRTFSGTYHGFITFSLVGIGFLFTGIAVYVKRHKALKNMVPRLVIMSLLTYLFVLLAFPHANNRTVQPLVGRLQTGLSAHPDAMVVSYDEYFQDLPPAIGRTVTVVGWKNELTFGLTLQPAGRKWMIERPQFWAGWNGKEKMYVVVDKTIYDREFQTAQACVLAETIEKYLVTNGGDCA